MLRAPLWMRTCGRGGRRDDVSAGWDAATAASDAMSAAPVAVAVGCDVRIPE